MEYERVPLPEDGDGLGRRLPPVIARDASLQLRPVLHVEAKERAAERDEHNRQGQNKQQQNGVQERPHQCKQPLEVDEIRLDVRARAEIHGQVGEQQEARLTARLNRALCGQVLVARREEIAQARVRHTLRVHICDDLCVERGQSQLKQLLAQSITIVCYGRVVILGRQQACCHF